MSAKSGSSGPVLAPAQSQQAVVVEVAASSSPVEVISAIVSSAATPPPRTSNPNRWLQIGFFFVLVFACIVYFREEIYTFTTDIHKYPILSVVEALQVRKYLGSGWTFGTGQDAVTAIGDEKSLELLSSNMTLMPLTSSPTDIAH
ncbi:hypothetical protein VOLCADRAFT_91879 [Volvox carteri f. nagariensis]|uniref:Uncharacterized protein n=1 Tax=Volvox carteri f. nagariensis TaxID=3068 RepID=D8TY71_VOLCA|nr:uncharacterized protein VOLCADRAFT_91879 [Volvox carteri f. nagariensis]EFJ47594.1 hypothetical protein VOLCADRAFT_91879 [Volvox carteri f. nagariensis]|eukprot:XP_002951418.1 hypothetical protein VOLCADRAFT_91879 [Volvox carteri f. nagariensis]